MNEILFKFFFFLKKKAKNDGNDMYGQILPNGMLSLSTINFFFHYIFWNFEIASANRNSNFLKWNSIFSSQIRILADQRNEFSFKHIHTKLPFSPMFLLKNKPIYIFYLFHKKIVSNIKKLVKIFNNIVKFYYIFVVW